MVNFPELVQYKATVQYKYKATPRYLYIHYVTLVSSTKTLSLVSTSTLYHCTIKHEHRKQTKKKISSTDFNRLSLEKD